MTNTIDTPAPTGTAPAPTIAATPLDAQHRLDALTADPSWAAKLLSGDLAARAEYSELLEKIDAGNRVADVIAGTAPPAGIMEFSSEDQLPRHVLTQTVDLFRDAGINDATISETLSGRQVTKAEVAATKALKSQRFGDAEWVKRLMAGGHVERREHLLMGIILSAEVAS